MKTGLVVISYNRPDYLQKCLKALDVNNWGGANVRCVSDDGTQSEEHEQIEKTRNDLVWLNKPDWEDRGVARNKNRALRYLLAQGCQHLFLLEDDIAVKSEQLCESYICYAKACGLEHLNFALHGPLNKGRKIKWWPSQAAKDSGEEPICVYPHITGAMSYYTRNSIETAGVMDERFVNAREHVEHTMRLSLYGFASPFWLFADHPNSDRLLEEMDTSEKTSVIDSSSLKWKIDKENGDKLLFQKYGPMSKWPQLYKRDAALAGKAASGVG